MSPSTRAKSRVGLRRSKGGGDDKRYSATKGDTRTLLDSVEEHISSYKGEKTEGGVAKGGEAR